MRSRGAAALALACLLLAGCGHHDRPTRSVDWHATALPTPSGSRALVRGATYCAGRWVVVGATADAEGETRPAVWASTAGATWRTVPLHPGGDYYASRAILTSVACSRGRLAALGAKSGGAHGLPRTATWFQGRDGSLAAVRAGYLLYGGTNAVAVSRLEGGPRGYLITGTRVSGAAVWTSRTGRRFRLHEGVPGLASTSRARSQALDSTWAHGRWVVVGAATDRAGILSGSAWTSSGPARWRRTDLPGGNRIATADRAADTAVGAVAAGLDDEGFGLWLHSDGSWSLASTFGRQDPDATEASYVTALADAGPDLAATYSDGAYFRMALGTISGGWRDLPLPARIAVTGDHMVAVAGHYRRLVLLTDDGSRGRIWLGETPH
jgi:hypothetical protein